MSMKRLTMTFIAAGALIFTAACGGGGAGNDGANSGGANAGGNDTSGNTVVITDIPQAYNNTCLSCHAADLSGNMPNTNLQRVGSRLSRDEIADIITNGKPNTMMQSQANRLSEEEINELADWLSTLK